MEPAPVDHKDTPGEYRRKVRTFVLRRVGGGGRAVADRRRLAGDWDVSLVGLAAIDPEPTFVYRLRPDGTAAVESATGSWPPSFGEWRLNPDGTLSVLTWCPPSPEFGVAEPQLDEDRRHLAAVAGGRRVAWNGDGSSVLLFVPRQAL